MNTLHHPQCQAFEEIIAKQKEEIEELRELALNLRGIVTELIDVAEVHADYTFEKINSCDDLIAKLNLCEKESV
jgi:hypothetical protein